MRAEPLKTLLAAALLVAAAALPGCKDEEQVPELSAEQIEAFQKRSDDKKRESGKPVAKKDAQKKAAAAKDGGKKDPKGADATAKKVVAKPGAKPGAKPDEDGAAAAGGRVTPKDKVRAVDAKGKAEAEARAEGAKAAEGAEAAEDGAAVSPAERRRRERQKRIEELKALSEERRKERLARLQKDQDKPAEDAGAAAAAEGAPEAAATPDDPAPLRAAAAPQGPVLDIARYVTINDVRELTGNPALAATGPLVGIPASVTYNSIYFAPPKRTDFGVSVQVWRETTRRDANDRFRRMRRDFPNAEDTSAVTPKGFFSQWNDLISLVFLDFTKRTIVAITCSQAVCTPEQLFNLATKAKGQI